MGKIKTRNNPMVIEKLNEIQILRKKLNLQKMENTEILTLVVTRRFGEYTNYNQIDALCVCNLLTQYKATLNKMLDTQENGDWRPM